MNSGIAPGAGVIGTSLWKAVNPPPPPAIPLTGRISTDVLIVGAGIAGLSLGLHLSAKRTDTVILESENDTNAATGASAGIIAPQLVRTTPNAVLKRLGSDTGARVLRMIAEGLANKEIAWRLGISEHTVKFHVSALLGKLGAGSRAEAIGAGIRQGVIML